ncbi:MULTISPECIES: hypothetical protein [Alphaproteobacteria]|uniref:Uncharacterized protein n=2 Tax=Alphaproteobacteria TaxID=28211 RepID=A0A512HG52_9HYPH|nr:MULTISPECIES: hypothetical protein [Alphaproteobacteria]GEO84411.1 hypothetical protein RNA01_13430 [Ciceribacter naphthalenivorans]GLR22374.1 hypothetical protein GCM10007920_21610 [Ciceribacter naphthalenivorans]GLT05230.1 hypothetical protein GCM10007926_21610 [Sphingomonas psychrolutea]
MALSVDDLSGNPAFLEALKVYSVDLRGEYDDNPRLARLLTSHQRWLLSQCAFALHLEYDPAAPRSGLTASRLRDMITASNAASRNTVLNFLDQMLSYRYISLAGEAGRRPRRFEATEVSHTGMMRWTLANLATLDRVDGGERAATLLSHPELFRIIQPYTARRSLEHGGWREPPPLVAMFQWTEAGGLVMDELVRRIETSDASAERYDIGRVDARALAAHFMMSRTHLQRLLRRAIEAGGLQWQDETKKTHLWFMAGLLHEYCGWQAIKFSIIDQAFDHACVTLLPSARREVPSLAGLKS